MKTQVILEKFGIQVNISFYNMFKSSLSLYLFKYTFPYASYRYSFHLNK